MWFLWLINIYTYIFVPGAGYITLATFMRVLYNALPTEQTFLVDVIVWLWDAVHINHHSRCLQNVALFPFGLCTQKSRLSDQGCLKSPKKAILNNIHQRIPPDSTACFRKHLTYIAIKLFNDLLCQIKSTANPGCFKRH